MENRGRRSSIRKTSNKDEDNTEVRLSRRISFSGKKFVRIFCGEEEPKHWDNSYEVSDHTNGDETASSKAVSERSTSKSCQTTQKFDTSNKENVEYSCATMDIVDRSQDSHWQIESSVNFTLLQQEIHRKKKLHDSLTNITESSSGNVSFLSQSEREKLKRNKNCPELLEETFSMELNHSETINMNRKPEGNNSCVGLKPSIDPCYPNDCVGTFEEKLKQISILTDSDDNMEESFTCVDQLASTKRNPLSTMILHENLNCEEVNDSNDLFAKNKTINYKNEFIDCSKHVTNSFKDKIQQAASSFKDIKAAETAALNWSALSSASSLEQETPLSSPLIPANYLSGSCTKKKLNFRQLNDEIEQGRLRIFADGPITPTIDKLGKNKHWLFEKHHEKSSEQKHLKEHSPLKNVNDMDISEITSNINAPKIVANTKPKTFRYSQADEMLLDNTNFLTHVKLGDETLSQNNTKCSNTRKTIYFSTNVPLDESVNTVALPRGTRNDTMHYLNGEMNAKETRSLDVSVDKVVTQDPLTNHDSEAHPKSRKTLHFDNIDMEMSYTPEGIAISQSLPTGGDEHTVSLNELDSFNADDRNYQSATKLKGQEVLQTPKMNRSIQIKMVQSLQNTPGRSLIEFEEMEQQCQDELFTPRKSKLMQMIDSKLPRKSTYEQIDIELETSPILKNVAKTICQTQNSTRKESGLHSSQNSTCKRTIQDRVAANTMVFENSNQGANSIFTNIESTVQDQVTASSKALDSFYRDMSRNTRCYSARAQDQITIGEMMRENSQHNGSTEREQVKASHIALESYNNEVMQNAKVQDEAVASSTVLENIIHTARCDKTEYNSIKETGKQQGMKDIDMEVDDEAIQQYPMTKNRRQTICTPIDIMPEDSTSHNIVVYQDENVNSSNFTSIRECLSLRENNEFSQSTDNYVPTCENNSAELDLSVCKIPISNSMAIKRASQILTPHYRNSKKRQTVIFEDCLMESTLPLPSNAAQMSMDCSTANKTCESFKHGVSISTLDQETHCAKTTKASRYDAGFHDHSVAKLQATQPVDNKSLIMLPNNSVYYNSFKLVSDLNTPLKHQIQVPRKNLDHENKTIFELNTPELRNLRKSESLCMNSDEIARQEQILKSLTLNNESNFKRLTQLNNEFINLSNDTMFLNGGQEATTNELLDETRISLVETLIHDEDEDDESIEPNAVDVTRRLGELKTPISAETCNKKCQNCALSLEDGENSNDSFMLPQLPQLAWVKSAMDRLRRLRAKPRLSDVHEYWRRKYMDETVNPDKCKSSIYSLVEELCQKPRTVVISEKSKRRIHTGVLQQRTKNYASKPRTTFVNRLKASIADHCPNWIFDYQLEARNQYIFPHRKLYIMELIVDYEYTDALGIDLRVKSVKLNFDRTPKKNWDPFDHLAEFELKLKMSYMLQPFSIIDNEKTFLHLLRHIDKACVQVAAMCNDLWNIICMKQAELVREADRTIIRKVVRKIVSSEVHSFSQVKEQEFIVEITNIKETSLKDILKPHTSLFEKSIQSLPNGLNFLSNFLEDPTKFLNP